MLGGGDGRVVAPTKRSDVHRRELRSTPFFPASDLQSVPPRKEGMEAVAATAAPADAEDARAPAGDREAFNSLYRPLFEPVYDYVLRAVGERDLAADAVRETFTRAWRAFPEQGNDVAVWLFTTARTCALESLRYRRGRDGAERSARLSTSPGSTVTAFRTPPSSITRWQNWSGTPRRRCRGRSTRCSLCMSATTS